MDFKPTEEQELMVQAIEEAMTRVDDPRLRLCLDVGHANSNASNVPVSEWIDCCAPYLSHVHLHNNEGDPEGDGRGALDGGKIA